MYEALITIVLKTEKNAQYYLKALKYAFHQGERQRVVHFLVGKLAKSRHIINSKELKCFPNQRTTLS